MPLVTGLTETLGSPRAGAPGGSRAELPEGLLSPHQRPESKNELRAEKPTQGCPETPSLPTGASALEGKWVFSQRDAAQAGKMGSVVTLDWVSSNVEYGCK